MMTVALTGGPASGGQAVDSDEALSTRLRDLALVDLDALVLGSPAGPALLAAFADDVADALREARGRIATLRGSLGGNDPLSVLDVPARQRAAEGGGQGADRTRTRLGTQADAARSLARLADLAGALVPKLFEADRRR
jgi:hypothetical protein